MAKLTLACIALLALAAVALAEETKYTSKYDNIDIDEVLKNKRLRDNYINCVMNRGKCGPDAQELKVSIPDALTNDCKKCTEKQKELSEKTVKYLIKNDNAAWEELKAKFDPTGIYQKKYDAEAKAHGIEHL